MTYAQAIQFLYDLRLFGAKFGLDNTFKLAALAGNPQSGLRFIHVAGTNGKGSTCAMLESIYRRTGLRVGLFTSPHLVSFAERLQVDRQLISEAGVTRLVEEMQAILKIFPDEVHPTFFEVVTVMAFKYFAEQNCDLVILETGLGGRLDATNIVTPLASVITNVQFDHQQWLGNTLPQIAGEKAGIIKPGIPIITGTDDAESLQVIRRVAQEKKSPLAIVTNDGHAFRESDLSLLGAHQKFNASVALETVRILQPQLPVAPEIIAEGLKHVQWAGRLQIVHRQLPPLLPTDLGIRADLPARHAGLLQTILLDGAHNPAGAQTLACALKTYFSSTNPALILGSMRDKDWPAMCRTLAPLADKIFLSPTGSDRTADPQLLVRYCREANPSAPIVVCENLAQAFKMAASEPFITLAGSLYIVGEAMELLHLSPAVAERGLNEWTASAVLR